MKLEILGTISMAGFSRLPVYEGDLDHIIGFVHVKDVLRQVHLGWKLDLRKLLRPALFVPKTLPLDKLLVQFREGRTHLAVVLDEFGGTEGIVTLDSVLEELIGEIHDEHSRDTAQEIVRRADGSWLVDGVVNLDDLFERNFSDAGISEQNVERRLALVVFVHRNECVVCLNSETFNDLRLRKSEPLPDLQ